MVGLSVGSAQIKLSIIDMNFLPISADFFSKLIQDLNLFEEARSYMLEKNKPISNYIFFPTPDNLFELQQKLDSIIADIIKIVENQDSYHMNIISLGIAFTGAIAVSYTHLNL